MGTLAGVNNTFSLFYGAIIPVFSSIYSLLGYCVQKHKIWVANLSRACLIFKTPDDLYWLTTQVWGVLFKLESHGTCQLYRHENRKVQLRRGRRNWLGNTRSTIKSPRVLLGITQ
jgi:hypothetical protein